MYTYTLYIYCVDLAGKRRCGDQILYVCVCISIVTRPNMTSIREQTNNSHQKDFPNEPTKNLHHLKTVTHKTDVISCLKS